MLFWLLTGRRPWPANLGPVPHDKCYRYICRGKLQTALHAYRIDLSSNAVQLLQALLQEDPNARPTVAGVRQSRWFISGGH